MKANYNNIQSDSIGDQVKLVPDIGFTVQINVIDVDQNRLRVTLNGITSNSGINPAVELYFQLVGVMHLSNPVNVENESHVFLRLVSDEIVLALNTEIDITLNFFDQTSQLISQYQDRKVFLTLLTLDADKDVVNYSNTFYNS